MSEINVEGIIAGLRGQLADAEARLSAARSQAESYRATADAIGKIYDDLKNQKAALKTMKANVNTFKEASYTQWKGNLWQSDYKTAVSNVESAYSTLISEIDINLDNLNLEQARYDNLANEQWGIVGQLMSVVNNIVTDIQNWSN